MPGSAEGTLSASTIKEDLCGFGGVLQMAPQTMEGYGYASGDVSPGKVSLGPHKDEENGRWILQAFGQCLWGDGSDPPGSGSPPETLPGPRQGLAQPTGQATWSNCDVR